MKGRAITLVLPFAPEERDAHDNAIAAACALASASGTGALDVLQLVPNPGAVPPRTGDLRLRWWEIAHRSAGADAMPDTVAGLAEAALRSDALAGLPSRLLLLPAAPLSEQVAALLASAFDGSTLGRCSLVTIEGGAVVAHRMAFGGRLAVTLRSDAAVCCATWRPEAAAVALVALPADAVRPLAIDYTPPPALPVEPVPGVDQQARLEGARLVVSGGRGIGGPEGFALLARVAQRIGGALGGSLPAVDAGWVPVARQVGVSGKFVTPRVYVAVGISGTPQHLAGIATSTRIVAVNKDPDAPIFGLADVGVIADWRELLPLVAQQLENE